MVINRRRAPSSKISSEKKLGGHQREDIYAALIGGEVIYGTQKGDVKDKSGKFHSVKGGKKWQVFLYRYDRICSSSYLNILQPCLDAFPENYGQYLSDREKCISFKEKYIEDYGRDAAKRLSNDEVTKEMGANTYIESKARLAKFTIAACNTLKAKDHLRNFLGEAFFNNAEVSFLAIKDTHYKKDGLFHVFAKDDVLDILTPKLDPSVSAAGNTPEDYNVAGQKTLLRYQKNGVPKNIVEIEIRNDSNQHYREVRFNMYSEDTLSLLLKSPQCLTVKFIGESMVVYGKAIETFDI